MFPAVTGRSYRGRGGGGVYERVHERKKMRITDHEYKSFVFLNHENKQERRMNDDRERPSQGSILQIACPLYDPLIVNHEQSLPSMKMTS